MTFSARIYQDDRKAIRDQIKEDAMSNGHGWSLLGIDPRVPDNNVQLNVMTLKPVLAMIDAFFASASDDARVFLHARYATTEHVGIAYCHGFPDYSGRIIMHNGIISNKDGYHIDSYRLAAIPDEIDEIRGFLDRHNDQYVNAFVIEPNIGLYTVIRRSIGSLYTDGCGNYSTNPVSAMRTKVKHNTVEIHDLDLVENDSQYYNEIDYRLNFKGWD
jgi:hypothetical protein